MLRAAQAPSMESTQKDSRYSSTGTCRSSRQGTFSVLRVGIWLTLEENHRQPSFSRKVYTP